MTFHWKRRIKGKRKDRALFPLFRFPCRSRQHTLYIIRHELNHFHSINTTFTKTNVHFVFFIWIWYAIHFQERHELLSCEQENRSKRNTFKRSASIPM